MNFTYLYVQFKELHWNNSQQDCFLFLRSYEIQGRHERMSVTPISLMPKTLHTCTVFTIISCTATECGSGTVWFDCCLGEDYVHGEQIKKTTFYFHRTFLRDRQRRLPALRGRTGDAITTHERTVMKRRRASAVRSQTTEGALIKVCRTDDCGWLGSRACGRT